MIFYACMLFHGKKKNIHKNQCCFVNQYQKFSKVEAIFPTDCLSLMQKSLLIIRLIQIVSRKNWKQFLESKQTTNWSFMYRKNTVRKKRKITLIWKLFREIDPHLNMNFIILVNKLFSRNFHEKIMRVKFCKINTVKKSSWILIFL